MEPYVSFETLRILFEPKLAGLIETFEPNSVKIIGSFDPNPKNKAKEIPIDMRPLIHEYTECTHNNLVGMMLALIEYCGKQKGEYKNLLMYFLAGLCVNLDYNLPE